ncbi:MAG: nucleotidyltransferase domain-containing protein [Candidatus Diapherotrites archaeon]|nr:nucleotidyltransferase domain-containing protein [Candidatus Diapherotrites archaeon]
MAHKITPSRQKFRVARQAVQELLKTYGTNLKAAYIAGSVASNMALHDSDIDLGLIFEKKPSLSEMAEIEARLEKINPAIQTPGFYGAKGFETRLKINRGFFEGMLPVFEREKYITNFVRHYRLAPNILSIRKRYIATKANRIAERAEFKRSVAGRKRFLPR